jgi:hypothetical protein
VRGLELEFHRGQSPGDREFKESCQLDSTESDHGVSLGLVARQ